MEPSWLIEHSDTGRRSFKKPSISSGVILIWARWLTPCPICPCGCACGCGCASLIGRAYRAPPHASGGVTRPRPGGCRRADPRGVMALSAPLCIKRRGSPSREVQGSIRAGKVLDAVDEVRPEPVGLTGGADVGEVAEELSVHDHDLAPGQMGAQTEVGAGGAEADVGVGMALHVEALGVVEDVLV